MDAAPGAQPRSNGSGRRLRTALLLWVVVWTAFIGLLLTWSLARAETVARALALAKASETIESEVRFRRWATAHGGVYVPVTEQSQPNPWLEASERDITTPSGRLLTLVNPSYMTRQVHELADQGSVHIHLTSLAPTNPLNAPDAWEQAALERLQRGEREVSAVTVAFGAEALRLLRPMAVDDACAKCHEPTSPLQGGLSASVPLEPIRSTLTSYRREVLAGYGVIWLLGVATAGVAERLLRRRNTERERATAQLRANEERYRIVADFTSDWEYWRGADGAMLYTSPSCERVTGYTREEFQSDPGLLDRLIHPDDEQAFRCHLDVVHSDDVALDFRIIRKDGEVRWLSHTCRVVSAPDGTYAGRRGSNRDVTDLRRATDLLRESEQDLRESQHIAGIGSYVFDVAAGTWTSSGGLDEVFGIDAGFSRDVKGWLQLVYPDERAAMEAYLQAQLASGASFDREYDIKRFSDGQRRRVHGRGVMHRDAAGCVVKMVGTIQDITERKELEAQLLHAQKLEAVGQLAGGVAHDFNNILAAVMMQTSLLKAHPGLPPAVKEGLGDIDAAAQRAADLTRQLLLFGRRQVMRRRRVDLHELLENLLKMLRRVLGERVTVELDGMGPVWVEADRGMLEQVVLNLCVNARDAMPQGGTLLLAARVVDAVGTPALAELSVTDTGHGMDTQTLGHLFEPFFTTKELGKGSGLGLAIVHGITQQHGGSIKVESAPGRGTTFRVRLPLARPEVATPPAEARPEPAGGSEALLFVEDDAELRHVVTRWLRSLGYRVTEATDGQEALTAWDGAPGGFDLVLTDMMMPGTLSGLELVRRLRQRKASLPAILMSGYNLEVLGARPPEEEGIVFVAKPFEVAALGHTIRACLEPRASPRPLGRGSG